MLTLLDAVTLLALGLAGLALVGVALTLADAADQIDHEEYWR